MEESRSICFQCGQDTGLPPKLNTLSDGTRCRACAERVLASLPPALPGFATESEEVEAEHDSESSHAFEGGFTAEPYGSFDVGPPYDDPDLAG